MHSLKVFITFALITLTTSLHAASIKIDSNGFVSSGSGFNYGSDKYNFSVHSNYDASYIVNPALAAKGLTDSIKNLLNADIPSLVLPQTLVSAYQGGTTSFGGYFLNLGNTSASVKKWQYRLVSEFKNNDNVRFVEWTKVTAVPLPPTLFLITPALIGLMVLRRKKQ
jgi:hypothetical protein